MTKQEKLQKLIDYYCKGNKRQFALMVGTSPQNVSTWLARGTYNEQQILTKCEHINAEWLMTGEGPMLKENAPEKVEKQETSDDYKKIINELLAVIATQNAQLERASRDLNRALDTINELVKNKKSSTTKYMVAEDINDDEQ